MAIPLAHAGHYALWFLYALPVLVVIGAVLNAYRQQRREAREEADAGDDTKPPTELRQAQL